MPMSFFSLGTIIKNRGIYRRIYLQDMRVEKKQQEKKDRKKAIEEKKDREMLPIPRFKDDQITIN
jgi:hypothetical protein